LFSFQSVGIRGSSRPNLYRQCLPQKAGATPLSLYRLRERCHELIITIDPSMLTELCNNYRRSRLGYSSTLWRGCNKSLSRVSL